MLFSYVLSRYTKLKALINYLEEDIEEVEYESSRVYLNKALSKSKGLLTQFEMLELQDVMDKNIKELMADIDKLLEDFEDK